MSRGWVNVDPSQTSLPLPAIHLAMARPADIAKRAAAAYYGLSSDNKRIPKGWNIEYLRQHSLIPKESEFLIRLNSHISAKWSDNIGNVSRTARMSDLDFLVYANELLEENNKAWEEISQKSLREGDTRVQAERDAEEARKAEEERKRLESTLREGLAEYEALRAKGDMEAASAKALALSKELGPTFPEEVAKLRVFATIETDPPGCSVLVEGERLGETPFDLPITVGGEARVSLRQRRSWRPLRSMMAHAVTERKAKRV